MPTPGGQHSRSTRISRTVRQIPEREMRDEVMLRRCKRRRQTVAMEGRTTCAVPKCTASVVEPSNLCYQHWLPGAVVSVGRSTMIVTAWYAEHGDEACMILLNDFALGDLFGGRAGFEVKLREQGFVNVRNLATPAELEKAKKPPEGKKAGMWGGPWLTEYPWEAS
jgi:hypothetical protein